jgi:hypothetical protein
MAMLGAIDTAEVTELRHACTGDRVGHFVGLLARVARAGLLLT